MPKTFHSKLYRFSQRIYESLGRDISLGIRIYLTAFAIILVVFSSLVVAHYHQQKLASLTKEIFLNRLQAMTSAQHLKENLYSHSNAIFHFIATKQPEHLAKSRQFSKSAGVQLTALRQSSTNPVIKSQLETLDKELGAYFSKSNELARSARETNPPKDAGIFKTWEWAKNQDAVNLALAYQSEQGLARLQKILSLCDEILLYNRAKLSEAQLELDKSLEQMVTVETWLAAAVAVFVLFLAIGLAASLLGSLRALLRGVRRVEEGDLNIEIPVRMTGELGELTLAFNRMARTVREQREQLLHDTITDDLTSAYNQRHFRKLLDREMERARRTKRPVSLLMIDIDHFKRYNDSQGHELGNEVLKRIAGFVRENLRSVDLLSRYGGDEFTAILPGASTDEARDAAKRLVETVVHLRFPGQENLPNKQVTLSIGGATFPDQAKSTSDLLIKADEALYAVKKRGRHGFHWAEEPVLV